MDRDFITYLKMKTFCLICWYSMTDYISYDTCSSRFTVKEIAIVVKKLLIQTNCNNEKKQMKKPQQQFPKEKLKIRDSNNNME